MKEIGIYFKKTGDSLRTGPTKGLLLMFFGFIISVVFLINFFHMQPHIVFTISDNLDRAVVGQPYYYSLCSPKVAEGLPCGGLSIKNANKTSGVWGYPNPVWGYPGYVFRVKEGSLPPGIILASNGILEGIPTEAGQNKFTICAIDSKNNESCQTRSITFTYEEGSLLAKKRSQSEPQAKVSSAFCNAVGVVGDYGC